MKPQYKPKTLEQKLGYLVEECGEVLAAAGKTIRWGLRSCNPELPFSAREANRDWLLRELADLEGAIRRLRPELLHDLDMQRSGPEVPRCGRCDGFGFIEGFEPAGSCPDCGGSGDAATASKADIQPIVDRDSKDLDDGC